MLFAVAWATVEVEMPIGEELPNPTADERWIGTPRPPRQRGGPPTAEPAVQGPTDRTRARDGLVVPSPTGDRVAWVVSEQYPHLVVTSPTGDEHYRGCATHYHGITKLRWSADGSTIASVARDRSDPDASNQVQWCDLATNTRREQRVPGRVLLGPGAHTVYVVRRHDRTLVVSDRTGAVVARIGNVPYVLSEDLQPDRWQLGLRGFTLAPDTWTPLSTEVASGEGSGRVEVHASGRMVACTPRRTYVIDAGATRVLASVPHGCGDPHLAGDRFVAGNALWDLDGNLVRELEPAPVHNNVRFEQAPDGSAVLRVFKGEVTLSDAEGTTRHTWTLEGLPQATFAREGRVVVLGGNRGVEVRSAASGAVLRRWSRQAWGLQAAGDLLVVEEPHLGKRLRFRVRDLATGDWLWLDDSRYEMLHLDRTGALFGRQGFLVDGVVHTRVERLNPRTGAVLEQVGTVPYKVTWVGLDAGGEVIVQERYGPLRFGIDWSG